MPRQVPQWQPDMLRYQALCHELLHARLARLPRGLVASACLLAGRPWLNPLHRVASFDWPVQRIGPRYRRPRIEGLPVRLVIFRTVVGTIDTLPACHASLALLESLRRRRVTGRQQIDELAHALGGSVEGARRGLLQLLETFRARGLVLGAVPAGGRELAR